jgi:hypothetical protein
MRPGLFIQGAGCKLLPDVTFCLQHGHVLSRDGYVCVHAEAERVVVSFYSAIIDPLPQAAGFYLGGKFCR